MGTQKKHRISRINQMLLEMASGNFFFRLERFAKNDNLEAISITLNMLAEEIEQSMLHQGFANSSNTNMTVVQMSFILDERGSIEMVNQQSCAILSTLLKDVIGKPFEYFLDNGSKDKWNTVMERLLAKEVKDISIGLKFRSKANLLIPKRAHLSIFETLSDKHVKILVTVIHHTNRQQHIDAIQRERVIKQTRKRNDLPLEHIKEMVKPKIRLSFDDIRKIREGHDILLHNPELEFPSLKEFALRLGTNEFKLKYGFKQLYGTSVYRFLMNERFRKAKMMIQYSDQPLKTIAQVTGFKSMSHFSRSFKKRYGYAPSELRKNPKFLDT